ncbi:PAS domain-containing protein [Syntrophomonas palmitatica]|uniref:PAS domain-containing protein n=1 Tax=Syntrophomonas palmitatica TaxID=402877 RepID=UPI0006CF23D3|nr:PAS domain S-box protein [Syntrophomonas palmitatica]
MPHSSSFYRTILDNTDTGYAYQRLITNEDGHPVDYEFIDVNPAFEKLTGWKRSDVKGQLISRLVPNFREIYADLLSRCGNVALRGQKENCEVYFYGLQKWFRIAAYSPEPGFIVAILSDISEFKKVEEELRESEARWKYALEGSGDGVWDWNVKDNKVFYSRQWKNILGFAEDEISNSLAEWEYRVHPDDRQQALDDINRCLSGETKMYYNEHRLCCKDGTYKWILDRGMVIKYDAEGKPSHMMGTLTDINRRKRLEQSLLGQEATCVPSSIRLIPVYL